MLNIVIPMAGLGSRFSNAGYSLPKPLIKVFDKTIIEHVILNLKPRIPHRFIFICQSNHLINYDLASLIERLSKNSIIIPIDFLTAGPACSVLLSKEYINNSDQLMIANCDQFINIDINEYLEYISCFDGLIMTMQSYDDKWSYVKLDNLTKKVQEVAEKKVISNEATVGIYNFKFGSDFVSCAEEMIKSNLMVNNEFYVAPVYNILIKRNKNIFTYNIGKIGDNFFGLGTPEDLNNFIINYPKIKSCFFNMHKNN